jgi:hypothetical protein
MLIEVEKSTGSTFPVKGDESLGAINVKTTGGSHGATVNLTRPSNATPYDAGDAIGDTGGSAILTFANMGKSTGGEIIITSVELEIDLTTSAIGAVNLRLYNASPTAIADNIAWDLVSGDRGKYLGKIQLSAPTDEGSTLFSDNDGINKQITLATGSLFVIMQTVSGFTPTTGAVKRLTIHAIEA